MTEDYFVVRRGRTTIPDSTVHDPGVSIPALGLLTVMLGLPAKAPMGYRAFLGRGLGEKAVRNFLRELEAAGYRWRFQARVGGQLRTVTLIFEEPASITQAWQAVSELTSGPVERCLNEQAQPDSVKADCVEQRPLSDRAATGAARSDKDKQGAVAEPVQGESPSRTVQRSSASRSSASRSTVARRSAAQPSKDGSNGWVTDVTQPNQTKPARDSTAPASMPVPDGNGRAGSGLVGLLDQKGEDIADQDWDVLVECLPPRMRRIEPSATAVVASALRRRVEAGWSPDALRATLAGNSLPPDSEIRNLAGIVSHRIGQVPVRPPQRRKQPPTQSRSTQAKPATVPLALQKRAEARETGSPDANQPLPWWFERYPTGGAGAGESA